MGVFRGLIACSLLACACRGEAGDAKRLAVRCDVPGSDHNALFVRGTALIEPHMLLHDRAPAPRNDHEVRIGIACLDRLIELAPSNWSALWVRGKAFQSLGEHDSAIESFRAAYQLHPKNPDVPRELAQELLEARQFDDAVSISREVADGSPQNAGLRANLALALLLAGRLDPARQAIDDALKLDPDDPISLAVEERIRQVVAGERPQPKTLEDLQR